MNDLINMAKQRKITVVFMEESEEKFKIVPSPKQHYVPLEIEENRNIISKLIVEINSCLSKEMYLAAFVLALLLPKILGNRLYPKLDEKTQYVKFLAEWVDGQRLIPHDFGQDSNVCAEVMYDIVDNFYKTGTFDFSKEYDTFVIEKVALQSENQNANRFYPGSASYSESSGKEIIELTISIRNTCSVMEECANRCYQKNSNLFCGDSDILIQNFDEITGKIFLNKDIQQRIENK